MKNFSELCERYGLTKPAFSVWLRRNKSKIDPKGELIERNGKTVLFSAAAVDKIDKLRGFDSEISLFTEVHQNEEVEALKNEINTLKTQLLLIQERTIKAQEQALAATAALNAATAAQIESATEKARKEAENQALQEKNEALREEIERLRQSVQRPPSERKRKNRWWR